MDNNINILVLNDINRNILRYLVRNLALTFGSNVKVSKHIIIPTTLFNEEKSQYNGRKLLRFLIDNMTLKEIKAVNLALFDRDLFIGSLDYAFGLASAFPRISVISILRLHPHFQKDYFAGGLRKREAGRFPLFVRRLNSREKTLYYNRILKEAIHGIGHTMGLTHCIQKECIMHPSDTINHIDSKETGFCKTCRELL
jgi:archaemetzincin